MFQPDLLAGRRILVTGGGSGLGAAMAARFAELGARLLLCGRRAEVLDATAATLRASGVQVDTAVCDVRDAAAVQAKPKDHSSILPSRCSHRCQNRHCCWQCCTAALRSRSHPSGFFPPREFPMLEHLSGTSRKARGSPYPPRENAAARASCSSVGRIPV